METISWSEILRNRHKIVFLGIVPVILISVFLVFSARLFWEWRQFINKVKRLPYKKNAFHYILGDIPYFLQILTMKKIYSDPVHFNILMYARSVLIRQKHESLFTIWMGPYPVVQTHSADAAETILNNSKEIRKTFIYKAIKQAFGNGILTSSGLKWKKNRRLLTPAFHFNILKDYLPILNKQANILVSILKNHAADEFVDIVPVFRRCMEDLICESLFGVEVHSQIDSSHPYPKSMEVLVNIMAKRFYNPWLLIDFIFNLSSTGKEFYKHVKIIQDFARKVIRERKEKLLSEVNNSLLGEKSDDIAIRERKPFLELLLEEHINENSISEEDIIHEINTFFFAGVNVPKYAASWTCYLIGLHPGIQEKIRQELDDIFGDDDRDATMDDLKKMRYLECVLKESFRLYPPATVAGRKLLNDVKFQNYIIPKGCEVFIYTYALHRDPEMFPNPEKFEPERFFPENIGSRHAFAFLPFAAGSRNCIAQRFSYIQEKIIVSSILRKFIIRSLDPRDRIQTITEVTLRPEGSLRLEFRPRDFIPEEPPVFYYP